MQFKNKVTGTVLSTDNELVIGQLRKNDRYMVLGEQPAGDVQEGGGDFAEMKKAELLTYAAQNGIIVDASDTKEKLIVAIVAAQAAKAEQ